MENEIDFRTEYFHLLQDIRSLRWSSSDENVRQAMVDLLVGKPIPCVSMAEVRRVELAGKVAFTK